MSSCPICEGSIETGTATFSTDLGTGVVVVRHVPATVCQQCGEYWLDDASAARLEEIVNNARTSGKLVEVIDLEAA